MTLTGTDGTLLLVGLLVLLVVALLLREGAV